MYQYICYVPDVNPTQLQKGLTQELIHRWVVHLQMGDPSVNATTQQSNVPSANGSDPIMNDSKVKNAKDIQRTE